MNIEEHANLCPSCNTKGDIKLKLKSRKTCLGHTNVQYRVVCWCGLCSPWEPSIDEAIGTWNKIGIDK